MVLTGFLGSGKTTLLNRMLSDPSMQDTAVVVNEFGAIGVDHLLVAPLAEDVVLLASGCLCCNAGDDLSAALASMLARRDAGTLPSFRRIVIETTGIAQPGAVLQRLLADQDLSGQLRIQDIVTVVDAVFGAPALERYPECAGQVAVASQLVLSKLDLVDGTAVESLACRLRSLNPIAPVLRPGRDGPLPGGLLAGTGAVASHAFDAFDAVRTSFADHADRYTSFWMRWDEPTDWEDFKAWLEGLLIARGDSILRMKGLLQVYGRALPLVLQGVQHALYAPKDLPSWPYERPRSELVFVTRDFPRDAAVRSFRQFFPYRVITH